MSKLLIIGGGTVDIGMYSMHPDILKLDGIVPVTIVTREEVAEWYDSFGKLGVDQCEETAEMLLAHYDNVRFIESECKPALCDIDESQSWQQMNKGHYSKKQRRGKL